MPFIGDIGCAKYCLFILSVLEGIYQTYTYSNEIDILKYVTPDACKNYGEYFNAATLNCNTCDYDKNLEPDADRESIS